MPREQRQRKGNKKSQATKSSAPDLQLQQPDSVSIGSSSTSSCPSPPLPKIKKYISQESHPKEDHRHEKSLDISESGGYTVESLKKLFDSEECRYVTSVKLSFLTFGDDAIRIMVESPFLTNLKGLHLFCLKISQQSIEMICNCSKFLTLESLVIQNYTDFGSKGVMSLIKSPYLVNLKSLHLLNTFIGDEGLRLLCRSNNFSQVRELSLRGNLLSKNVFELLRETKWIKNLEKLTICGNEITKSLDKKKAQILKDFILAAQFIE